MDELQLDVVGQKLSDFYIKVISSSLDVVEKTADKLIYDGFVKEEVKSFLSQHKFTSKEIFDFVMSGKCDDIKYNDLPDITLESETGKAKEIIQFVLTQILESKANKELSTRIINFQNERGNK